MEKLQKPITDLHRESYVSNRDKKEYYRYFVSCVLRGKEFTIDMVPQDIDGYEMLDLIFDGKNFAPLFHETKTFKNDKNEDINSDSYCVRLHDNELNIDFECPVKVALRRDDNGKATSGYTSKNVLAVLIQLAEREQEKTK